MLLDVFVEGDTEKNVIIHLMKHVMCIETSKEWRELLRKSKSGKGEIVKRIRSLGAKLDKGAIRCLVMRDLDTHENEKIDSIRQSAGNAIGHLLERRKYNRNALALAEHPDFPNVFIGASCDPDIRFALHIADYPPVPGLPRRFIKSTTDDYLLILALQPQTASNLLRGGPGAHRC